MVNTMDDFNLSKCNQKKSNSKNKYEITNMEVLSISTERLIIRNLRPSDLEDFHFYRSNPDVTIYQGFEPMTILEADDFINSQKDKLFGFPGEWVQYGIEHKSEHLLIGDCAIRLKADDSRVAEIGITISHLYQRKGYGKEILLGILTFLFDEKNVHRVVETVDTENVASINLLKSTSFRLEGHFVENIFFKGKWGSEFQFAMLKREWNNIKPRCSI
jgi:ribosomal-protein-alanine N-acetyltransferase